MTPPKWVKDQNVSYFQNFQNALPPTDYKHCHVLLQNNYWLVAQKLSI